MISALQKFFETHIAEPGSHHGAQRSEHAYRLATAALLVEMSRADNSVEEVERRAVSDAVRRVFDLSGEETTELVGLAEAEADQATSLYEFTRLINESFSPEEKQHVVELLWEVAFADGELDKYEEHLVRKIADLIYVPHRDFIQVKHRVQERLGID